MCIAELREQSDRTAAVCPIFSISEDRAEPGHFKCKMKIPATLIVGE
jgi:hypothetical protein